MRRVNLASLEFLTMAPQPIDLEQDLVLDQFDLQATCSVMGRILCSVSPRLIFLRTMEMLFFRIPISQKFARY